MVDGFAHRLQLVLLIELKCILFFSLVFFPSLLLTLLINRVSFDMHRYAQVVDQFLFISNLIILKALIPFFFSYIFRFILSQIILFALNGYSKFLYLSDSHWGYSEWAVRLIWLWFRYQNIIFFLNPIQVEINSFSSFSTSLKQVSKHQPWYFPIHSQVFVFVFIFSLSLHCFVHSTSSNLIVLSPFPFLFHWNVFGFVDG